ncbi:hypothetical protein Tco_1415524, partial [Tanacetum coccineum]
EDEVQEVRRSRPIDRDQAKRKSKAGTSSTGSTNAFDVESLAKLMAKEYAMATRTTFKRARKWQSYCRSKRRS